MTTPKRTGRPKRSAADGQSAPRERIVDAARAEFAAKGFRGATLRSIAAAAGVDVALIAHYFGSKAGLFAETLDLPPDAVATVTRALASPPDQLAHALTAAYLGLWESPSTGPQLLAVVRAALADDQLGHRMTSAIMGTAAGAAIAPLVAGRELGFQLAMSHLVGVAVQRHVVPGSAASQLDFDELVARVAPAIDIHLRKPDVR